jgi:hypothetical protein
MAKDPKHKSEFEQNVGHEPDDETEDDEEDIEEPSFEQPFCPRCGWHNTRPSHTANILDLVVRVFGLRPFRCRSCGNRFRAIRRVQKT